MSLIWLGDQPDLDRELVGGKAFSINTMLSMGLPVPPAYVLSTQFCAEVLDNGATLTTGAVTALRDGLSRLEAATGKQLGDPTAPLLVSVRSGGARSMPGMMDTVLDLGINDAVERALAEHTGDPAFAADTHRRYREQFLRVVGVAATGDAWADLQTAAAAVFGSWSSPRAVSYRRHHGISDVGGTAVTVQAMVFGNLDDDSGTGVLFTRNPLTGDPRPYGEWLPRGQGEDVVSGRHDAQPLDTLAARLPGVHRELIEAGRRLEDWGKDSQDIEFTVEAGRLWLLQTRAAKRSPQAAVRIAVALHEDGVLTRSECVALVNPDHIEAALRPGIDGEARRNATLLARGEPACPGIATGHVVDDCDQAEELADSGQQIILARPTTDPDDVSGMIAAAGVVTEIGGATSHAAVVSRELGTPCVVGCGPDTLARIVGRVVTVDGATGEVFDGALPLSGVTGDEHEAAAKLRAWSREQRSVPAS